MSSTATSSSSSLTPAELIDNILMTNTDKPDFLSELVTHIDELLAHDGAQPKNRNPIQEKLGELPSASEASNLAEQVSTNVKFIANQIKENSGNKHETSIAVLNAIGNVHWVAVGFLVVGAVLNIVNTIENNKEECFRLLKSMNNLAKVILLLQPLPRLNMELQTKLKESINLIVDGAFLCCSQKKRKGFIKRVWKASTDGQKLQRLNKDIDAMHGQLHLLISTSTFEALQLISPSPVPTLNNDAVGIEEKIEEVIQQLDLENENTTTKAVIVYGIGGSGKTTLADAVYASLKDKLLGWKHSRVTLIENLEKNPDIEKLQSLILQDFTATKQRVRDFQSGRQSLKDILEKESVFLYVDNALFREPLEKLLPKDVRTAKKLRLLITARETIVSGVTEGCGVEHCKLYPIEPLSIDAALQVLCQKIDIKREKDSILEERPQARKIAEKCNSCPLVLEVIGAYLHQRKNKVVAYERVLDWLQSGEDFSGSENFSFDEKRVLFSFEGLKSSAKEAFFDLCSFFYYWDWETVACIVGEEEMECLEEGALIKREDKKIKVHDLILAAGRNKSKNNRFKNVDDFSLTLQNKEVKGIWMDNVSSTPLISAEELAATSRSLRVFYMKGQASMKGKCGEHFDELRFLHVERRLPNLATSIFNTKHLRYLEMSSFEEDIVINPSMNLPNLNVLKFGLKFSWCRIHGIAEIAHLRSLKELDLSECNTDGISQCFVNLHNLRRLRLHACKDLTELPQSLVMIRCLEVLNLRKCRNLKQLPAGFGELVSLTVLDLSYCSSLQELPCDLEKLPSLQSLNLSVCRNLKQLPAGFGELVSLTVLDLSYCWSLQELPCDLEKLPSLQSLNLRKCRNLKQLPAGFGELVSLTVLDLSYCSSLQELPCDLEKLPSLQSLDISNCSSLLCLPPGLGNSTSLTSLKIRGCKSLTCLPHGLGGISAWGSNIFFNGCSSLSELPEEICEHRMLTSISFDGCSSLKMLPSRFGELTCLQHLVLSGCESLQELCNDFHCLVGLKSLYLSNFKKLSSLPLGFGKLSSLQDLNLSGCDKLEELCSDFHCLVALKYLYLSGCSNLVKLPDRFGDLSCLERLDLSGCSNLVMLSDDFHLLRSLTRLNLSKCEKLGGEWMDSAGNIGRLWLLDIVHSERMKERWMEMKSQKERSLVVVTDVPQDEEGRRALLLEGVLSKIFDGEGLLLDAHQRPFHSSSLQVQSQTPLILIIDSEYYHYHHNYETLKKNLQQLQFTSKDMQIIYVGRHYKSLTSELSFRILAYTPDNSGTSSFCHQLSAVFETRSIAVFRSTDQLELNGLKCLSAWEDMSSYILDRVAFLTNTPRESNIELLRELLVTEKTDYLLLKENHQVKVADLQGKLILLLGTYFDETLVCASAVKEMYLKMQAESHNHLLQVVWVPIPEYGSNSWEEFERAGANAPWPLVPNPWLIQHRIQSFVGYRIPCVCVMDEKGRILNKDAMATIDRWGFDAYPFCEAREEELWKAEWEGFKFNSLSTLQFVFENLQSLSNKAKEMMDRGVMMLVCVGSAEKMMEVAPDLNRALTMLEIDFQVLYVAYSDILPNDYDDMAWQKLIKETEADVHPRIATLSFSDVYKFWRRVKHLQNDLMRGMGTDERIVKVRRMVLGLARAEVDSWSNKREISMLVVDGNGEVVSGRGMEVVELLCHGEEDSKGKFVEEIKKGGVSVGKSVESRWRDGIIHPKHFPQHPLLEVRYYYPKMRCSLCGREKSKIYQCNVCEKYAMCEECSKSSV